MIRWCRLDHIATTTLIAIIIGFAISQVPAGVVAAANGGRGGYEMRVCLDRTLSLTTSRVGDRFIATVADPGPFNLARIFGHVLSIMPSESLKGATEMRLSFDRIRFRDGQAYPISAEIIRLYDVPSGEQVEAELTFEKRGGRRPQTLKRTGIGALADGIFGLSSSTRGGMAIRPRVIAAETKTRAGRNELTLDHSVEMLLRIFHN